MVKNRNTEMLLSNTYMRCEEIVSRNVLGETILVPIKGRLADMEKVFILEDISEFIWSKLDGNNSVKNVLDEIIANYTVSNEEAKSDLFEFIKELVDNGLVVKVG